MSGWGELAGYDDWKTRSDMDERCQDCGETDPESIKECGCRTSDPREPDPDEGERVISKPTYPPEGR